MAEFKKWISYLYTYRGDVKEKNVGFVRVEVREGRCRMSIGVKGAYGCDDKGLQVGLYMRTDGRPQRFSVSMMSIRAGCGEWEQVTQEDNLFGTGVSLQDSGGVWLTCQGREMICLASWEKSCLDIRDFLPEAQQKAESEEPEIVASAAVTSEEAQKGEMTNAQQWVPQPSLWDSLCRYYPRTASHLGQQGIDLLQICPADIRYLPRNLWYYGNNSFLLHGYYRYKYLVLGRICSEGGQTYLLGIPGVWQERERYSARMFGFRHFLPLQGKQGFWYTQIHL